MKVDRYTKVVLTVIAVALSALAINYIVAPQPAVAAAPAMGEGRYQFVGDTVIDTRSGTLYRARGALTGVNGWAINVAILDTRTGYPRAYDDE